MISYIVWLPGSTALAMLFYLNKFVFIYTMINLISVKRVRTKSIETLNKAQCTDIRELKKLAHTSMT